MHNLFSLSGIFVRICLTLNISINIINTNCFWQSLYICTILRYILAAKNSIATRIFKKIERKQDGSINAVAWYVEKSQDFPEGIKYAFAFIVDKERIIGYDNERAKGHHRHFIKDGTLAEQKVQFISLEETAKSFYREIKEFRKNAKNKQVRDKNTK